MHYFSRTSVVVFLLIIGAELGAQSVFSLQSPDKRTEITVEANEIISWSVARDKETLLASSEIGLDLLSAKTVSNKIKKTVTRTLNTTIPARFYKKNVVTNHCNELTIYFNDGKGLVFRAYDDGVAYRFFLNGRENKIVGNETARFNFSGDYLCYVPYVCDLRDANDQFCSAFESLYDQVRVSGIRSDSLALTPLLVVAGRWKLAILEAGLQQYPGMFLTKSGVGNYALEARFAPVPLEEKIGGFANLNLMPSKRAEYIAEVGKNQHLPWRVLIIAGSDKELLNSDMVYRLSEQPDNRDMSWIMPGKVAWDWWNHWNITGVDFKAGCNTQTYQYYIDFAADNKLEYIIMDEGWSASAVDVMNISPAIDLPLLIRYAEEKGVGIMLWASYRGIYPVLDSALKKYADMGIKGFKIDFFDRDDQKMVNACYEIAEKAFQYKLVLNYHGIFKPSGMNVKYPNILNFEGVRGLENCKWHNYDAPLYDVTMPFIRMLAGPVDYTPGAMRNATKSGFRPLNDNPNSQGTRCHQMALYVAFEAPMQMLCDNPTIYRQEQECTSFIAAIPTVFDETIALDGELSQFITIARRKGESWYVSSVTNWNQRYKSIDFSFLPPGNFEAEVFVDGLNADRNGIDYSRKKISITAADRFGYTMAPGGGMIMKITKIN